MAMRWMRQFQELGHLRFAWIAGKDNLSDLLTKPGAPGTWLFWSPYFFLADWLQVYVSEMIFDQLGVKVESWVPSMKDVELGVDAEMEDVLGGVRTDELELPGMETVVSGGGRVKWMQHIYDQACNRLVNLHFVRYWTCSRINTLWVAAYCLA